MSRWAVLLALTTVATATVVISPVRAAESGLVSANGVDVRRTPSTQAKSHVKLSLGRPIKVDDHQQGWVHVTFVLERGEDRIPMEGWIQTRHVRARSRFGFSFQRRTVGGTAVAAVEAPASEEFAFAEPETDIWSGESAEWGAATETEPMATQGYSQSNVIFEEPPENASDWSDLDSETSDFDPGAWGMDEESIEAGDLPWDE